MLKINKDVTDFYLYKRSKLPKCMERYAKTISIHRIVELNAGIKADYGHQTNSIFKINKLRGGAELRYRLIQLARSPGCLIEPKKRAAYCRRILRKINKNIF